MVPHLRHILIGTRRVVLPIIRRPNSQWVAAHRRPHMYEPPAANWYPDPADASLLRYWDGHAWTEHRAPLPVSHDFHKRA